MKSRDHHPIGSHRGKENGWISHGENVTGKKLRDDTKGWVLLLPATPLGGTLSQNGLKPPPSYSRPFINTTKKSPVLQWRMGLLQSPARTKPGERVVRVAGSSVLSTEKCFLWGMSLKKPPYSEFRIISAANVTKITRAKHLLESLTRSKSDIKLSASLLHSLKRIPK